MAWKLNHSSRTQGFKESLFHTNSTPQFKSKLGVSCKRSKHILVRVIKSNIFKSLVKSFFLSLTPKRIFHKIYNNKYNNSKLDKTQTYCLVCRVYLSIPLYAARSVLLPALRLHLSLCLSSLSCFPHSDRHKNPFLLPKQNQEGNSRHAPSLCSCVLPRLAVSVHIACSVYVTSHYRTRCTVLEACIDLAFLCWSVAT